MFSVFALVFLPYEVKENSKAGTYFKQCKFSLHHTINAYQSITFILMK